MVFELPFDAVVGRYVLRFQADPGAMLRRLATLVPTGGLIAFHELTGMVAVDLPPVPTYDTCCAWTAWSSGTPDWRVDCRFLADTLRL